MLSRSSLGRGLVEFWAVLAVANTGPAYAQVLLAEDDSYSVRSDEALVVEAFGVLDNDTLDGEAAGENGATVELVTDVSYGTLALGPYGSFTYMPGAGFDGTDSFVYRAVFSTVSDEATVTLTACTGGPQIFTCWKETAFLAKAAALGHASFKEGFEDDVAWGLARSPNTQPSVSSRGFTWRSNHPDPPASNEITTGSGPAITGQWGIFDREHGYATGTSGECDVDNPPAHCLFHDGFTISRGAGSSPLYGAGGFFGGTSGANVAIVLDGDSENPVGGGNLFVGNYEFFGVIDAGPVGLTEVQFRETDGKVGQELFIFGDDFTVLAQPTVPVPALDVLGAISLGVLLVVAGGWYVRRSHAST